MDFCEGYGDFAAAYDALTFNVPYDEIADYYTKILCSLTDGKRLLDMGCGTGSLTVRMKKRGFDVIGQDASADMLTYAAEKSSDIFWINQKMEETALAEPVDAIISTLDSVNHLPDKNAIQQCFQCAADNLRDGGAFVFDVNTVYKHNEVLADNTFVFDEDDYYLVWDNEAVDDRTVRILLDIFLFNGENYDRFSEEFEETAYSVEELSTWLKNSGFVDIKVYDELSYDEPKNDSERLYFVCKKV